MKPVVLFLLAATTFAQQNRLTPELTVSIRSIRSVQLSPDGTRMVFEATRPRRTDENPGQAIREIYMINVSGGDALRLTYHTEDDKTPQWSPDGSRIAFLSKRGNDTASQIYLIAPNGGEAMPLTKAESNVASYQWSPDGTKIAYVSADKKSKPEEDEEKAGRDWTLVDKNIKHNRLYIIDLQTRQSALASKNLRTVNQFAWAPDSKRLVVSEAPSPSVDDTFMRSRLMTVLPNGEARLVAKTEGKLNDPCWSPDGKWIAWLGATAFRDPFAGSVFVAPVEGGSGENLTPGYEGSANWLGWLPGQPATLAMTAIEKQSNVLYKINVPGRERVQLARQGLVLFGSPSFSRDGKLVAVVANHAKHPNEVFVGDTGGTLVRRTRFNPQLDNVALGEQEEVRWQGPNNWTIEGVIVKPVGYEKGKRYPTVMQPHGGPESADLNGWLGSTAGWGQLLAARGYVTFYPNYRGSIGRGAEFAMADHKDLMGREWEDMVAGLDHLIKAGIADGNRLGIGGGSYGGYTSAWAATYGSERFKASVPWMGISNWFSMTGTSEIFLENSSVHWNLIPYDPANHEIHWKRSPLAWIHKANTPSLIIHGAVDPRVPIGQSQELYTALKWKGVPVEFVTYPREGHGVLETAHQLDFFDRVLNWFDKYLK